MATWKKVIVSGSSADLTSLTLDTALAVAEGGTGATTLTDGGVLLGSGTGAITALGVLTDGQMIVGDGTTDPVAESGATLRTSIGVGTGDSPQFTGIELGHASDTTITRASSGNLNIEGNLVYRAGGTDVPVADGGTGASTLTDGGVLLGSGTGAITATAALGDGEMLVGDGTTDPSIESGATLRTSIGVGTGDSPTFTGLTLSGDLEVQGGDITLTNGATDIDLIDNNANALSIDASGAEGLIKIDTTNSSEAVHMSKALNVVGAVSGSSTAEFASLTLDTALAVAEGGTGATSLTDKAVLISQDSGTDAIGSLALTGNGEIIVGGTSGPAVEAAADVAGTGLDAAVGDGTFAINVAAAQTSITSLINSGLTKIGTAADQEYIKFDTSNEVNTHINNTERLSVTATGVDVTGALTVSTDLSVSGGDITLTGAATDIDLIDNNASALSFDAAGKAGILEINTTNSGEGVKMSGDLTVEGNFVVNGDTTQQNVANLLVQDRFLLLNSGSTATGDGGMVIGSGSAYSGSTFIWDDSVDRWGTQHDTQLGSAETTSTPEAYASLYVLSANTGSATYKVKGNIRVDDSDESIWIYS